MIVLRTRVVPIPDPSYDTGSDLEQIQALTSSTLSKITWQVFSYDKPIEGALHIDDGGCDSFLTELPHKQICHAISRVTMGENAQEKPPAPDLPKYLREPLENQSP